MNETKRQREYRWDAPSNPLQDAQGKSGWDYLKEVQARGIQANPYWQTLGFIKFDLLEKGKVLFTAEPKEYHANILGSIHGGFYASLMDSAMTTAAHSLLPKAGKITTVQFNLHFVRALRPDQGEVYCLGEAVHIGRKMATASGKIIDSAERIYCHGTTTMMLFD